MEKNSNDFIGFAKLFNDENSITYFNDWVIKSGFGDKFSKDFKSSCELVKDNKTIGVKYSFEFNINFTIKDIDINYICDSISDVIPYNTVKYNIIHINKENECGFFKRYVTPKYNNQVQFIIPFEL